MTHGSLFAGIGGFDLGFERAGIETKWQVEIDPFCQKVLAKHWPNTKRYGDIRECGKHNLEPVDIISGGFPCQPVSVAGKKLAQQDERWLWPEFYRIICELRPRFTVLENVTGLLAGYGGMGDVLRDLAACGFDAEWQVLRASDFGAPHTRERICVVAYAHTSNGQTRMGTEQNWPQKIFPSSVGERLPIWLQAANRFIGVDDGLSAATYRNRAGTLGNAIVPQIAEWIGRRIMTAAAPITPERTP